MQIANIRSERGYITTDLKTLKVGEYHKQVCVHEFNSLEEMEQIVEKTSHQNSKK